MNVYKNLKNKAQIEHQFYLQAKKSIPVIAKSMGMDFSYFGSDTYTLNSTYSKDPEKQKEVRRVKDSLNYYNAQAMDHIGQLIHGIKEYRSKTVKGSVGTDGYMKKFDIFEKLSRNTVETATIWWRDRNPRTYIDIKCQSDRQNDIEKGQSHYSSTGIFLSPLWYHKVFKHGLHDVVYKGRPCFVMKVEPYPVRRLQQDDIDVHKATILHSHGGDITMIDNMYLASFKQMDYTVNSEGKVIKPSERVTSVSPELKRAEVGLSQRIGRNVIGSLLS